METTEEKKIREGHTGNVTVTRIDIIKRKKL